MKWLGHVIRINKERMPRKNWEAKVEGNRTRGPPRHTWEGRIEVGTSTRKDTAWAGQKEVKQAHWDPRRNKGLLEKNKYVTLFSLFLVLTTLPDNYLCTYFDFNFSLYSLHLILLKKKWGKLRPHLSPDNSAIATLNHPAVYGLWGLWP